MPVESVNGIEIYYETAGSPDAPPLLLITGLTGNCEGWFAQVPELQEDFYVISFDNRGAGRSSQSGPGYGMGDFADDTAALLDALDIAEAYVFGISMGGMVALNLAVNFPEKVTKLALGCTTAGGSSAVWPEAKVVSAMTAPSCGDRRQDLLHDLWFILAAKTIETDAVLIEQLADVAENNLQTEIGFMGQFQATGTHDVTGELAALRMPVLVMHGDLDILIPFANGRYLADHIPGAEFEIFHNAGHLFYAEQGTAVNRRLRAFFIS